jgi:beta-N-acetylhexosaminidase
MTAAAIVLCTTIAGGVAVAALQGSAGSNQPKRSVGRTPRLANAIASGPGLTKELGQLLMAGMDGTYPDSGLLAEVRSGRVGGVILFGENVTSELPGAIDALQYAASEGHNPPLLIATDQEGGPVRRFSGGPPTMSTRAIKTPSEAFTQGRLTGEYLRAHGVNVDLAPVSDVSGAQDFELGQERGFNGTPAQVAGLATRFVTGLQQSRVAATAKHFPGIGTLAVDTDSKLQRVEDPASAVRDDMLPFAQEIDAGVKLVMVANAVYPALDPVWPASMSAAIQRGVLREQLHFHGVIITDALDDPPQLPGSTIGERAVHAASAGADIILLDSETDGPAALRGLLAASRDDSLSPALVARAYNHVLALKRWVTH